MIKRLENEIMSNSCRTHVEINTFQIWHVLIENELELTHEIYEIEDSFDLFSTSVDHDIARKL
jgi:hypothetical protein